jgi:hypothetical protein
MMFLIPMAQATDRQLCDWGLPKSSRIPQFTAGMIQPRLGDALEGNAGGQVGIADN